MTEEQEFMGVIKRAKKMGYSKQKVLDSLKGVKLQAHMMWMMTPVTDEKKGEALARDYQKATRLEKFIKKSWSKEKLKKVM